MSTDDGGPPAPFRFSRESRIRIDRDGAFWHEGQRVTHPRLAQALASWIDLDEASGRWILRNSMDWCFVQVDDTPLVVRGISFSTIERPVVRLSDGTDEDLALDSLRIGEDDVPYCAVKGGRFPARFGRQATFDLLERASLTPDGVVLSLGALELALRPRHGHCIPSSGGTRTGESDEGE